MTGASLAISRRRWTSNSAASPVPVAEPAWSFAANGVERIKRFLEIRRREESNIDLQPGQVGERTDRFFVERIGDAHRNGVVVAGKRKDVVAADEVRLDQVGEQRLRRHIRGLHKVEGEKLCQRGGEIDFRDKPKLGQHPVEPLAGRAGGARRTFEHKPIDDVLGDEEVAEILFELRVRTGRRPRGLRRLGRGNFCGCVLISGTGH